ncbi:MAG: hypothetical protein HYV26_01640 [Candidatus Hydrogenedentes bacterium]|nr:hypothetical protein [Candidatus Hydrogenedentota bacterium]
MSVVACAMNEALLQSHDGVIRVAPAIGRRNARFTLHATNGFVVSAEISDGELLWVCLLSQLGRTCTFENPWEKAYAFTNGYDAHSLEPGCTEFPTNTGDVIVIGPTPELLQQWTTVPLTYEANQIPKTDSSGKAALGLPRMF